MTVQQLLDLIEDMYPSATTDAVKVKFMNLGQEELSDKFGLVVTNTSLLTKANYDEYALPAGIEDISQIETFDMASRIPEIDKVVTSTNMIVGAYALTGQLDKASRVSILHTGVGTTDTLGTIVLVGTSGGVSTTETITPVANDTVYSSNYYTSVTSLTGSGWVASQGTDTIKVGVKPDRYDTVRYQIGYKDDKPMGASCIYQGYSAAGVKSIIIYPAPTLAGLPITIRYHAKLPDLSASALSASPEFDSQYHSLLATYACWQICKNGSSPDSVQATQFAYVFDEGLTQLWKKTYQQQIIAPRKRKDNAMWHGNR
jgi:hypothetical protein